MTTVQKSVLAILPASNFNEQEFITIKNLLKKKGFSIFIASNANTLCIGSSGLRVKADVNFYNIHVQNFAAVVFVGGEGVRSCWNNHLLHKIAVDFNKAKKITAAICSAPIILANAGILSDKTITCYPADKSEIQKKQISYKDDPVVVCGNIITGQSPAAASEFTNILIEHLSKQ